MAATGRFYEVYTAEATFVNEPTPTCGASIGKTVWFRIRPTLATRARFSTNNVDNTFDTVLAAYKSTSTGLTQVACNDDVDGTTTRSQISFMASGNTTYYIQVGGYQARSGNLFMTFFFTLANDSFSAARTISPGFGAEYEVALTSNQSNEPQFTSGSPYCPTIVYTAWFKYKTSSTRVVTFDTFDSEHDTIVNIWRGTSISNLTKVACNDDGGGPDGPSVVTWTAQANKTYYIQVGHYQGPPWGKMVVNFVRGE
jgi:hypothetical protein